MAWTTPLTAVSNAALTAAQWNASVRDNLLTTGPALATTAGSIFAVNGSNSIVQRVPAVATQLATETTGSLSYTATLSGGSGTAGPSLTITTGPKALVAFHTRQSTSVSGVNVWTSVAVVAGTAISASDNWALSADILNAQLYHGLTYLETSLTAGSNQFQMQYRIGSAGTFTASTRRLSVVAF